MGATFSGLVTDGPLLVAALVAALVGLISFASPCVLPLVPGYLSYVAGLVGTGTRTAARVPVTAGGGAAPQPVADDERSPRGRMVLGAVLFVLVALGARWALGATSFLRRHARTVTRVGGAVLVVVGLLLLTGAWTGLMEWLRSWLATTGLGESSI